MARFGSKPDRGKRCRCDNPQWSLFELRVTSSGDLVITFDCRNCKAFFDTKSRDMRKHLDLDAVYKEYNGEKIYIRDLIQQADDTRRGILNTPSGAMMKKLPS